MTSRIRGVHGVVALILLILLAWGAVWSVQPPAPAPSSAPEGEFSAQRAQTVQKAISQEKHPTGTAANRTVRDYLVTQLTDLGLRPEIQDAVGAATTLSAGTMARVSNITARIPGTEPTKTLFLVAHYDSAEASYGAGDDGTGTATLIETARALTTGPALRNDIVLLFTDAEEACLCGAEAFVNQNPLAQDGGVVLNFEARGGSGPAIMFETAKGNEALVDVYGSAVQNPVATSLAVEVYRLLPNDTDFSLFRDDGRFTGLNTAFIDSSRVYHSPQDDMAHVSSATLQHMGENALATTRALGAADLTTLAKPAADDASYFPVLGQLVRYPGWLVWPIAGAGLLSVIAAAVVAVRRRATGLGRLFAGFGLAVLPLAAIGLLAQPFWKLLVAIRPDYTQLSDPWHPDWLRVSLVALVFAVVLLWFALLRKRIGATALVIGGLMWLGVLGAVTAAFVPGGSYLVAIPAVVGGVGLILQLTLRWGWIGTVLAAAVAVLILAPTVALFFPAMGLANPIAAALITAFLALAVLPALAWLFPNEPAPDAGEARPRWIRRSLPPLAAVSVAVIAGGIGLAVDVPDAAHPIGVNVSYAMDADTGQAQWVRIGADPTGWSDALVDTKKDVSGDYPRLAGDTTVGKADAADLSAPDVTVESDETSGGDRVLTLRIASQRDARLLELVATDGEVVAATADGRKVDIGGDGGFALAFHAPPAEGLEVVLTVKDSVTLRVWDVTDGVDDMPGFVPRPDDVAVKPGHTSDLVVVARTVQF